MTEEQKTNWIKLALGLGRVQAKNWTERRRKLLLSEVEEFIGRLFSNYEVERVRNWDGGVGSVYVCDELDDYLRENRYERERHDRHGNCEVVLGRFGDALSACIRAGFDMAVEPSAGVVGFTVGDLREALDGEIPEWVQKHFDTDLNAAPDSDGVWL